MDFLGFQPTLHIHGKSNFKSLFTSLLSLIVTLLSFLCAGYFGSELITHTIPTVIVSTQFVDEFKQVEISNKGFLFLITLEYENYTYYTDPTVYQIRAFSENITNVVLENNTAVQLIEYKDIEIDICEKYYTQDDLEEKNMIFPLDRFYCAKPNSTSIQGFWGANTYVNLRVELTKCVNSTENNFSCRPIEEIDRIIQNGYVSFEFTNYDIDPKNYTNPLKRLFQDDYNLINANSSLEYSINLMEATFVSDNGLIFNENQYYNGHFYKMDTFIRNTRSNYIVSFNFQGNASSTLYTRYYTKLQTVLTQIGGFIKAISIIASMIAFVYSKNYFFIIYLSNIFDSYDKLGKSQSNNIKLQTLQANLKSSMHNMTDDPHQITDLKMNLKNISNFDNSNNNMINPKKVENFNLQSLPKQNNNLPFKRNSLKKDIATEIKYLEENSIKSLIIYLCQSLCICKQTKNKSSKYKIICIIKQMYEDYTSVDFMITRAFEFNLIRDYIETKYDLNIKENLVQNVKNAFNNELCKIEEN